MDMTSQHNPCLYAIFHEIDHLDESNIGDIISIDIRRCRGRCRGRCQISGDAIEYPRTVRVAANAPHTLHMRYVPYVKMFYVLRHVYQFVLCAHTMRGVRAGEVIEGSCRGLHAFVCRSVPQQFVTPPGSQGASPGHERRRPQKHTMSMPEAPPPEKKPCPMV
jgi:hypothetical protein